MEDRTISVSRIYKLDTDSKLKAFADVAIGDFLVKGFRVCSGKNGLFLGFPQEKGKDGKWYESFCPLTKEAREILTEAVLSAYQE